MGSLASIIIVSYNNYDITTGPCLESLVSDGKNCRHEIIVVDNDSRDGTAEKLQDFAAAHPGIKLILNSTNRGFAGGNNDGVGQAGGEHVILLNSDTVVPPAAMDQLHELLNRNTDWGMLGPVTNQAGNEQKIHTRSADRQEVLADGRRWCEHSHGASYPSERLDFFCVAMPKRVYEGLGGLDETFGRGYYEDTDFSLRARKNGIKMYFTEDVFVYHQAGRSFSRIGKKAVRALMKENRAKLHKKHPDGVPLFHMRERNLHIMSQYVLRKKDRTAGGDDLDYKFENRLLLAREQYPNNPFKKLRHYLRLRKLRADFQFTFSG